MTQKNLIKTLKKVIKEKGIFYKDIANHLNVSEQTIKRIFFEYDSNISRIYAICEFIDYDFCDLVNHAYEVKKVGHVPTQDIFDYFAMYPHLFSFFNHLAYGYTLKEIETEHHITRETSRYYLKILESIGYVERLSGDKFKLLKDFVKAPGKNPLSNLFFSNASQFLLNIMNEIDSYKSTQKKTLPRCALYGEHLCKEATFKEFHSEITKLVSNFMQKAIQERKSTPLNELQRFGFIIGATNKWISSQFPPKNQP